MTDSVTRLKTPRDAQREEAAAMLHLMQEEFDRGEVVCVAAVLIRRDGTSHNYISAYDDVLRLMGAVAFLQHEVAAATGTES